MDDLDFSTSFIASILLSFVKLKVKVYFADKIINTLERVSPLLKTIKVIQKCKVEKLMKRK